MPTSILQKEELSNRQLHRQLEPLRRELGRAELGDRRLTKRLAGMAEKIGKSPAKGFPQIALSRAELEAFYRFFGNEKVQPDKVVKPHIEATCQRVEQRGLALALHDTTGVSYAGEGTREGLGRLNDGGQGYYLHGCIATSADGLRTPLGLLGYETLIRTESPEKKPDWKDKKLNDPNRESLRWWRLVEHVEERLASSPAELIHVMDREADDYELLAKLLNSGKRFVIRLKYDRLLDHSVLSRSERATAPRKVKEALSEAQVVFEREVQLSARKKDRSTEKRKTHPARKTRRALLHGAAARVCLRRPNDLSKTDLPKSITLNVVHVWEVDAPTGVEPVEWYLLSSEPIDSAEQILQIVDWYRARWVIEEFWKALKTGCSIEKRQLESKDALLNVLALFLPVAYRLLLLRELCRHAPELPATVFFSKDQLQLLRLRLPKVALPLQPTLHQAFLATAALGGHLKHNGEPGWLVLGRGFQDLLLMEVGWRLARQRSVES